ncbi:MAG TPA: response regulator [Crinalium sp.]|jgi:twitching motility two-component system response regulator PilH
MNMKSKTVLIVEDSRADQRLIEGILRQVGLMVTCVDSAEQALNWIAQKTPDLMVVDVVMPGISGFDLCRQIRSNPATERIPVVFCTSKDEKFDRFWGLRQGAAAYITKPFAPNELIDAVRTCLPA